MKRQLSRFQQKYITLETIFTGYFVSKAHLYSNIMICVAAQAVWEESCLQGYKIAGARRENL